jgi:hypothetical protein
MSLRYAIMTALLDDEMSGYDLARAFDKLPRFFWHASHQQIYRELRTLRTTTGYPIATSPDGGSPRPPSLPPHGYGPGGPR